MTPILTSAPERDLRIAVIAIVTWEKKRLSSDETGEAGSKQSESTDCDMMNTAN
jgi:hypothetical protein